MDGHCSSPVQGWGGTVCVFLPDADSPLWILEKCILPVDDLEYDDADDDVAMLNQEREGGAAGAR